MAHGANTWAKGKRVCTGVPTNIYTTDTGTCLSLVGETQHCESNAFTELMCPLLCSQGSWDVRSGSFRSSVRAAGNTWQSSPPCYSSDKATCNTRGGFQGRSHRSPGWNPTCHSQRWIHRSGSRPQALSVFSRILEIQSLLEKKQKELKGDHSVPLKTNKQVFWIKHQIFAIKKYTSLICI